MKKLFCAGLAALCVTLTLAGCAAPPASDLPETEEPPVESPEAPPVEEPLPKLSKYILIKEDGLNVRTGAGTSYSSLGTVEKGVLLHYERTENGWYETLYQSKKAYVSANAKYTTLFTLEQAQESTEQVIDEGLKLLGVPYVYGAVRYHDGAGNKLKGFTTGKFDCSSLMQYIFSLGADTNLGVTTRHQVYQGERVTDEIKRGDLLFFTNSTRYNKVGVERVGHVALYLGGNYILHTASDYAKIEQISAQRWSYYLEARRFFL